MGDLEVCNKNELKQTILNTKTPLVIHNISSEMLKWTLTEWQEFIGDDQLPFRLGKNKYTQNPQWENTCTIKYLQFKDFVEHSTNSIDDWLYFDYKHLRDWFVNKVDLRDNMVWSKIGFSEITLEDSTIWIGSKGAHTPCHVDTYGCNMVYQVYGQKLWLLFPPEENLNSTRVPYEESSIYSKLNFFSPNVPDFNGLTNCHKVILNPGDILVVPHKWWHYVENLGVAISINAWLPLPEDNIEHIRESITALLVGGVLKDQNLDCQQIILNPNMIKEMINSQDALIILSKKLKECKVTNKRHKPEIKLEKPESEITKTNFPFVSKIEKLNDQEFRIFVQGQSNRFSSTKRSISYQQQGQFKEISDFLEVITDDEVISLIMKKLLEK